MIRTLTLALLLCFWPMAAFADFEKGFTRFEQGDYEGAYGEMKPDAARGDARAQYVIGVLYLNGLGVEPDDEQAHYWLRLAGEGGHTEAQVELARLYRDGLGVAQDLAQMVTWYERAAARGHVGAQLFVADAHAYGQGVEVNLVSAYAWYEVARRYWGDLAKHAQAYVADKLDEGQLAEARKQAMEIVAAMDR